MPPKEPIEEEIKKPFCVSIHPADIRYQYIADSINRTNGYRLNTDEGVESETDWEFVPNEEIGG